MTQATIVWFAQHEARLAWRDATWWLRGTRRAGLKVALVTIGVTIGLHLIASLMVVRFPGISGPPNVGGMFVITGIIVTAWMLMLSQAMESVTRVLYARGDIELILSSPTQARHVFVLRLGGVALGSTAMAVLIMGPFLNVLAAKAGLHWLGGYGVLVAMGATASAAGILMTAGLFWLIGPKRTRFVAQIVAAVLGAAIVIGLQIAAILGHQGFDRFALLERADVIAAMPAIESSVWIPARAAMGDVFPLVLVLGGALSALILVILLVTQRFDGLVIAAGSVDRTVTRQVVTVSRSFASHHPRAALRDKELKLLARDPWLISQTLMQILYLLPPALLLWQGFGENTDPGPLIVPVLVMAAGQLSGGLAWLTISGEDAPDLIQTAPVSAFDVFRAKVEAVFLAVALPMCPLLLALTVISPLAAVMAAVGTIASAGSATAIQLFFRSTAKRSGFRRRQTASRASTFCEAFSSISWAGAAALAAIGSVLAAIPAVVALTVLGIAKLLAPRRD